MQGFQRRVNGREWRPISQKSWLRLQRMGVAALREKYAQVFGEATMTGNRTWLLRRIAWRIQANAEGDLSQRARLSFTHLGGRCVLRSDTRRRRIAKVWCR